MGRPYTGKITESRLERPQKNGTIYVYKKLSWYDPKIKNTRSKLELLGIKTETGEIVPTRPKSRSSSLSSPGTPATIKMKSNAMICIVEHFSDISGVAKEVADALPSEPGRAQKILTLAWYAFATDGRTWTRADKWTASYLEMLPYSYGMITKDIYTELFHYIGEHPEISWSIFQLRAKQFGEDELICWDSTVYECWTKSVHDSLSAPTKDGLIRHVYKVFFFYSITSRRLMAYVKIPGNIADCSTVPYAIQQIKALHLKNPEVLQDNGYTDDNTIGELLHQKTHFITRLVPSSQWISKELNQYRDALVSGVAPAQMVFCEPEFSAVHCRITHTFYYRRTYGSKKKGLQAGDKDSIEATVHVFFYYSSFKRGLDDKAFREHFRNVREDILTSAILDTESKKFRDQYMSVVYSSDGEAISITPNQKAIENKFRTHGFLVLLADKEKDPENALLKFRSREKIEEQIKGHKSHTGGDTSKTGNDNFLDGELLVEFLGDTIRESMVTKIGSMLRELAVLNGDRAHDTNEQIKLQQKLKSWLRKKSIANILDAYDTTDIYEVGFEGKSSKMTDSTTARSRLFLEMLGIHNWGKA